MARATRKQTLRSLSLSYQKDGHAYDIDFSEFDSADIIDYILERSVSYQKKDGRGHARPAFFWYDNDKDLKVCFLATHVICSHVTTLCPTQLAHPLCIMTDYIEDTHTL